MSYKRNYQREYLQRDINNFIGNCNLLAKYKEIDTNKILIKYDFSGVGKYKCLSILFDSENACLKSVIVKPLSDDSGFEVIYQIFNKFYKVDFLYKDQCKRNNARSEILQYFVDLCIDCTRLINSDDKYTKSGQYARWRMVSINFNNEINEIHDYYSNVAVA